MGPYLLVDNDLHRGPDDVRQCKAYAFIEGFEASYCFYYCHY